MINVYIKNKERSHINKLTIYFKKLKKKEQTSNWYSQVWDTGGLLSEPELKTSNWCVA